MLLWLGIGAKLKLKSNSSILVALAASLVCLLVYLRALGCDFVNYDDYQYIVDNPAIRKIDGEFLQWAFTTTYLGWLMPLTWISFAIDYSFWGLDPVGYHLTNILLHAANTGLVVLVADRFLQTKAKNTEQRSNGENFNWNYIFTLLLAALLWGLHPLRVESVAWATERKDVLNGLFFLLSIVWYLSFVQKKEGIKARDGITWDYLLSITCMFLSILAKPVSVVLPAMLLVLDCFLLGRFRTGKIMPILVEKIPYFIFSIVPALVTIYFASGESLLVSYKAFTIGKRFILAGNSLLEYCWMALYPVGIINMYLLPQYFPVSYTIKAIASALFICFFVYNYKKYPCLLAVAVLFILPLIPVLGFFQNGAQAYAARFTYLPMLAPSIAVAVLLMSLFRSTSKVHLTTTLQKTVVVTIALLMVFYVGMTLRLIDSWKNPETLWSRVIEISPAGRAYYLRAAYYSSKQRYAKAADDLQKSIDIAKAVGYTGTDLLYVLRANSLSKLGRYAEAVVDFNAAIELKQLPKYFYHRGRALQALGRTKEAEADFKIAGAETGAIGDY